jgi:hypothetical protein
MNQKILLRIAAVLMFLHTILPQALRCWLLSLYFHRPDQDKDQLLKAGLLKLVQDIT